MNGPGFNFWPLLIGAGLGSLFAAIFNLIFRLWQYERDHWLKRVDLFCESVQAAADAGSDYWAGVDTDLAKRSAQEGKVIGAEMIVDGLMTTISNKFTEAEQSLLDECLRTLREALTGGTFQSARAANDPNRVRELIAVASDFIVAIRKASDGAISHRSFFRFLTRRPYANELPHGCMSR